MSPIRLRNLGPLLLSACISAGWFSAPPPALSALPAPTAKAGVPNPAGALDFANTYAVIVGVLRWPDSHLAPFPTAGRKDQELYDLLRKRGVPAQNMDLLLDQKATLVNIRGSLRAVAARAKPGSTFLFYYAGHGWRRPDGATEFANYDYDRGGQRRFAVAEIADVVGKHFEGARVLLFADCCFSGGLEGVARGLGRAKIPAAALTSADSLSLSTKNWTFTQTLIECFAGNPLLGADGDAVITLGELAAEVALAMEFRERQKFGYAAAGVAPGFGLAATDRTAAVPGPVSPPFALKDFVTVPHQGKQRPGRVVGFRDGKYLVEIINYSEKQAVLLPASALRRIQFQTYKVGQTVAVARPGLPRAKVVETAGNFHRVVYAGHPGRGAEWLLSDQIVDDPKSVAEVQWQGQWYPATVLKTEGGRYSIHYLGYDDSWDEWVTRERIRFPGKAGDRRNPFGVADVATPVTQDIRKFAARVSLPGGPRDRNAEPWVKRPTAGKAGVFDGDWSGRWDGVSGTARVKVLGDRVYVLYTDRDGPTPDRLQQPGAARVYVLYTDRDGPTPGRTWLLEAVREKERLVGRWVQVGNASDTGPYAGRIVDDERIDGTWGGGRWDLRRKLAK
jgi:hypothetical protein